MTIEQLDRRILSRLAGDARVSWAELAQELGLSAPAIGERVKRLKEKGLLLGFHARLAAPALGLGLTAFVAVTLTHPRNRESFLKVVRQREEILEAHHMAGDDDFLLKVLCRDTAHLETLLTSVLKSIAGVQRTRTSIVLGTAKEFTALRPPAEV